MGVKVDFSELYAFNDRLKKVADEGTIRNMIVNVVNEANNRHVARVEATTPVETGTLKRGWANGIQPARFEGNVCVARLSNPVEYSPYVEYGHRTRGGKGWVEGRFFMSKSLGKAKGDLNKIATREVKALLGGAFNGK